MIPKSGDYIRPMKVMEVLGGGRYRAFYAGAHYEVFAPSAASLSVGDLVMARVVRKAGQLFVPKVAPTALFLAPGQHWESDGHNGQGTIYKLVGAAWQLLAHFGRDRDADPDNESDEAYVTCMFWDNSVQKLYAIPWYYGWVSTGLLPNPQPYDLYQVNTTTGVGTALGHSAVMRPLDEFAGYWNNPYCYCQQAAKFGSYWFITGMRQEEYDEWPGSYYERAVLYKFDPVANTMIVIDSAPQDLPSGQAYNMGVATDGATLYWWLTYEEGAFPDHQVYRRTTDGVNFVIDEEHDDSTRRHYDQMKYNPANGRFQVGGYKITAPRLAQLLYRNASGSWVVDQSPGINNDPYLVVSIGFRYIGNIPQYEYLLTQTPQRVYSRSAASTGAFVEETIGGANAVPVFNSFASLSSRVYCFKGIQVFHRDSDTGAWTAGTIFTESGQETPRAQGFCVASSIPISEM